MFHSLFIFRAANILRQCGPSVILQVLQNAAHYQGLTNVIVRPTDMSHSSLTRSSRLSNLFSTTQPTLSSLTMNQVHMSSAIDRAHPQSCLSTVPDVLSNRTLSSSRVKLVNESPVRHRTSLPVNEPASSTPVVTRHARQETGAKLYQSNPNLSVFKRTCEQQFTNGNTVDSLARQRRSFADRNPSAISPLISREDIPHHTSTYLSNEKSSKRSPIRSTNLSNDTVNRCPVHQ
jgi:hypothetical protein